MGGGGGWLDKKVERKREGETEKAIRKFPLLISVLMAKEIKRYAALDTSGKTIYKLKADVHIGPRATDRY